MIHLLLFGVGQITLLFNVGQVTLIHKESYEAYEKIVIKADIGAIPQGWKVAIFWNVVSTGVSYEQMGNDTLHVWASPGEHVIFVNILLVNPEPFELKPVSQSLKFRVQSPRPPPGPEPGPGPGPGPGPNPNIPEDRFNNIGQKVAQWASEYGVDNPKGVGKIYEEAGKRLLGELSPPIPTIDLASSFITAEAAKVRSNIDAWNKWGMKTNEVWREFVRNRTDAAEFFKAVAIGLR
jgi:hypothetical protein